MNRKHREKLQQMVDERTADLWNAVRRLELPEKAVRNHARKRSSGCQWRRNSVYRKGFKFGEAMDMMSAERGTHFDPRLLDLFFDSLNDVVEINAAAAG